MKAATTRRFLAALAAAFILSPLGPTAAVADDAAVQRGAYIFAAADCTGCHTDAKNGGKPLAGGRALATPFGTFYGPNITPDPKTGIGDLTEAQFHRALREGINEHGRYMYPVFPFTSFTGMTDADISDLWAFLRTEPPVEQRNKRHDLRPPFGFRFTLVFWRLLFFRPGPLVPDPAHDAEWNRGNYLANAVAH